MFSQRHKIIRRSGFLASLLLLLLLCGCGRADISAYEDTPITIAGLTEETFSVTPKELRRSPVSAAPPPAQPPRPGR